MRGSQAGLPATSDKLRRRFYSSLTFDVIFRLGRILAASLINSLTCEQVPSTSRPWKGSGSTHKQTTRSDGNESRRFSGPRGLIQEAAPSQVSLVPGMEGWGGQRRLRQHLISGCHLALAGLKGRSGPVNNLLGHSQ